MRLHCALPVGCDSLESGVGLYVQLNPLETRASRNTGDAGMILRYSYLSFHTLCTRALCTKGTRRSVFGVHYA